MVGEAASIRANPRRLTRWVKAAVVFVLLDLLMPAAVDPLLVGIKVRLHSAVLRRLDPDVSSAVGHQSARFIVAQSDDAELRISLSLALAARNRADYPLFVRQARDLALVGDLRQTVSALVAGDAGGDSQARTMLANVYADPDVFDHEGTQGIVAGVAIAPTEALFVKAREEAIVSKVLPLFVAAFQDDIPEWFEVDLERVLALGDGRVIRAAYQTAVTFDDESSGRRAMADALASEVVRTRHGRHAVLKAVDLSLTDQVKNAVAVFADEASRVGRVKWLSRVHRVNPTYLSPLKSAVRRLLARGNLTAVTAVEDSLLRIRDVNDRIGFAHLFEEPHVATRLGPEALRVGLRLRRTPALLNNLGLLMLEQERFFRAYDLVYAAYLRRPRISPYRQNLRAITRLILTPHAVATCYFA